MAINSQMNSDIGIHSGMRVPKSQLRRNEGDKDEFSKIFQSKTNDSKPKVSTFETNDKKFEEVKPKETEKFETASSREKLNSKKEPQTDEKEIDFEEEEAVSDQQNKVVLDDFLALLNQPLNLENQPVKLETSAESQIQTSEELLKGEEPILMVVSEEVLDSDVNKTAEFSLVENKSKEAPIVTEALLSETNFKDTIKKALNMDPSENSDTPIMKAPDSDETDHMKLYPVPENPKVIELNGEQIKVQNESDTSSEAKVSEILASEEPLVKIIQEPKEKEGQNTFKLNHEEGTSEKAPLVQSKEAPISGFQQMINRQPLGVFTQETSTVLPKNPIANQVFEMIKGPIQLSESGTMLKMKLQPEELGQVHLKLSLQKGLVLAEIKVENELVKAAMESNVEQLKQSLSNKGFQVSQVSVTVDLNNKDQAQSQFGQSNQGQNQRANKYFDTNEDFNDESIFEALQLKDRGIGTSIDYSG